MYRFELVSFMAANTRTPRKVSSSISICFLMDLAMLKGIVYKADKV